MTCVASRFQRPSSRLWLAAAAASLCAGGAISCARGQTLPAGVSPETTPPDVPVPAEPVVPVTEQQKPFWESDRATGDWGGLRTQMENRGISLDAKLTLDWSANFHGGLMTRNEVYRHLLNVNLTLDTQKLIGWEGGTFFTSFQQHSGRNGAERLTGDLQGFDNIDAEEFSQVSELWYEQRFLQNLLRVKIGKVDANSEFAYVEHGAEFLNSSMGYSPTILGFPSYPDPATSVNVFVEPVEWFYAGVGLYDGATQDASRGRTGNRGPATAWGKPSDWMLLGEMGFRWSLPSDLPGRLGLGGWGHSGRFAYVDESGQDAGGTQGFYLVADQMVWRENPALKDDTQGIGLFGQFGYADEQVSEFSHHIGGGLAWTGAIPTRDNDVMGLGASYVSLSPQAAFAEDYELAIEGFYKVQFTPWASLKPDVQYIVNPGGGDAKDAIVGTLRLEILF